MKESNHIMKAYVAGRVGTNQGYEKRVFTKCVAEESGHIIM